MNLTEKDIERLVSKVHFKPGCWTWLGARSSTGYGNFGLWPETVSAHAAMYEAFVGPVPPGLDLDHACHNDDLSCPGGPTCPHRLCVNAPLHLEPATRRTNTLRGHGPAAVNAVKTECLRGHPYTPENTYIDRDGKRSCKPCRRAAEVRFAIRHRGRKVGA